MPEHEQFPNLTNLFENGEVKRLKAELSKRDELLDEMAIALETHQLAVKEGVEGVLDWDSVQRVLSKYNSLKGEKG